MTRSLVSEIKTLVDVYNQSDENQINYITSIYKKNYDYVINVLEKEILDDSFERKFSPMDRSLRRELKSTFGSENYWFNTTNYMDIVEVKLDLMIKFFNFCFQKKNCNFIRKTFYSLVNGPIINFNFNSNTFFENQTKPIVKLAKAAEKFGKGDYVNEFKTSGALEIRKASYEFDRMAKELIDTSNNDRRCYQG